MDVCTTSVIVKYNSYSLMNDKKDAQSVCSYDRMCTKNLSVIGSDTTDTF